MTTDNDSENYIDRKKRTTITAIGSLGIELVGFVGLSDAAAGRYGRDRRRSHQEKEYDRGGGCGKWCRGYGLLRPPTKHPCRLRRTGIGVDIRDDGRVMATQLFCTSG